MEAASQAKADTMKGIENFNSKLFDKEAAALEGKAAETEKARRAEATKAKTLWEHTT